jgi:hypothetical protein
MDVPMLDEEEFAEIEAVHSDAIKGVKHFRKTLGADMKHPTIHELFHPVREK